jgi:hypothetical protein
MGIFEKIVHLDTFHIHIYKEGVFWVAYEQSAYYFWLKKGYKPTKKFIKTIGKEVVSVGFPQNTLAKPHDAGHCSLERDEPNVKTFLLEEPIDPAAFEEWKTGVDSGKGRVDSVPAARGIPAPGFESAFAEQILTFPLSDRTPMECMLFLSELKKQLTAHNHLRFT